MVDFSDLIPKPANLQMSGQQPQQPGMFDDLIPKIDYSQPNEQVRAAIQALPEEGRRHHYDQWAKQYVAKENQQGGVMQAVDNSVRTLARGSFVGPWLGELQAGSGAAMHAITGGKMGAPYQEGIAYQNARDDFVDEKYPVMSTAGQLATGIGSGVRAAQIGARALSPAGLVAGPVGVMQPAQTWGGRAMQTVGAGAGYGANSGAGDARGGFGEAMEGAARGGAAGALLGGAAGLAGEVVGVVRSATARTGQQGAYDQFARSLPANIDDFERSAVLGTRTTPTQNQGEDLALFRRIGDLMVQHNGDRNIVRNAILGELRGQGMTAEQAADRIRRLTGTHQQSPLFLGEYGNVAEANEAQRMISGGQRTTDAGRQTMLNAPRSSPKNPNRIMEAEGQINLMDNVVQGGGQAATNMRRAVSGRQADAAGFFEDAMQASLAPRRVPANNPGGRAQPLTLEGAQDLNNAMRGGASQDYRRAHTGPIDYRVRDVALPSLLNHMETRAASRAGEAQDAIRRGLREFQGAENFSLQQLQDARGALRGQMNEYARAGRDDLMIELQPFCDNLTRMMNRMSPAWARANQRWSNIRTFDDALELGQRLSLKAGPAQRQAMEEYVRLAAPARQAVQIGLLRQIYDKVGQNLRDTNDVSKVLDLAATHNLIRRVFGDRDAITFARLVRDIEVGSRTQNATGNSRTNLRGRQQEMFDADLGIAAAAQAPGGAWGQLRRWIAQRAMNAMLLDRNSHIASITTTPMRDTFGVAQHMARARSVGERLRAVDRPPLVPASIGAGIASQAGQFLAPE